MVCGGTGGEAQPDVAAGHVPIEERVVRAAQFGRSRLGTGEERHDRVGGRCRSGGLVAKPEDGRGQAVYGGRLRGEAVVRTEGLPRPPQRRA